MSTRHWHIPVLNRYMTDYGEECEVDDWVYPTRDEAVREFGRDDPFYVYPCDDEDCLIDIEWYDPDAALWGRND